MVLLPLPMFYLEDGALFMNFLIAWLIDITLNIVGEQNSLLDCYPIGFISFFMLSLRKDTTYRYDIFGTDLRNMFYCCHNVF